MSRNLVLAAGRFRERLHKSRFGRNVVVLAGGTVVARGISVLAAPILSRLYTPVDFGVLSIFISCVTFVVLAAALNYEAAIPLPEDDNVAYNLMIFSLAMLSIYSVICTVICWLAGPAIARHFGAVSLIPYMGLLPISMFCGGLFQILNWWALRVQAFKSMAKRRVNQSVFQVLAQSIVPFISPGPLGLLLGDSIGRAGGSITLAKDVRQDLAARALTTSPQKMLEAAKRYKRFPMFGLGAALVHSSYSILPPLLLTKFFGLREAGWYTLINQVLCVPLAIIGVSVVQVYTSNAAQLAHSSPTELRSLFLKTSRLLLLIGVAPLALVALTGPTLFTFVFGAQWHEAGVYSSIVALPFLITFVVGPVFPTLTLLERQDWQLVADLLGTTAMVAGMWCVWHARYSARWAVGAYGVAVGLTYLALFLMALAAIQRKCRSVEVDGLNEE